MRALRWVDWRGRVDLDALGARPVEGGREADGTPLFVAQAHHHNAIVPGKCSPKLSAAFVPYDNTEKEKKVRLSLESLALRVRLTLNDSIGIPHPVLRLNS